MAPPPTVSDRVWYVYGVIPDDGGTAARAAAALEGVEDARVTLEPVNGLTALVSVLDAARYGPAALESSTADVEWISPRAVAHDQVLTWASERGPVVPFPMFSIFSGRDAVHDMLRERRVQLTSALDRVRAGREYALRVFRLDAELLPAIGALSPRVRTLEDQAAAASPGQRYLLERKLVAERKAEAADVTQRILAEITDTLSPFTLGAVRSPLPRLASGDAAVGTMVLNASFLVATAEFGSFQRALTALVDRHGRHGFRFDFTGPWPPYHFVTGASDDR